MDWRTVEVKAASYMAMKRALGRWKKHGDWDFGVPAMWSMIEEREVVP